MVESHGVPPATTSTPSQGVPLAKYHGLGNDYIVIDPAGLPDELTPPSIRRICDRHYGAGAGGILLGPLPATNADFALRIFNPDGSEAEKSGNGLRIFARYMWDRGLVGDAQVTVPMPGGRLEVGIAPDWNVTLRGLVTKVWAGVLFEETFDA